MTKQTPKYDTVDLDQLRRRRRGKHHELMQDVMKDLEILPKGKAIEIPLASVKGVSLANLRAAISRATSAQNLSVKTYSDGKTLFIWKD